jgi:uncharacterized protein (DUF2147 family)
MRIIGLNMLAVAATLLIGAAAPEAPSPQVPAPFGMWRNPHGTVIVHIYPCASELCGKIVWASPDAVAAARDAHYDKPLVGTELLSNYRPDGPGRWTGTVFVPDRGSSYSSKIVLQPPAQLDISGCLIGGFFCKHQTWNRV